METVVAIDPGHKQTAVVVWNGEAVLWCEIVSNADLLETLHLLAQEHKQVAIERMACYGKPVGREVLETCEWIGRMMETAIRAGAEVTLIYRREAVLNLCQSCRGVKDSHVRQALIDKHGPVGSAASKGPLYRVKKDMWAALAIADTWMMSRGA